jgi:hypothetical protein
MEERALFTDTFLTCVPGLISLFLWVHWYSRPGELQDSTTRRAFAARLLSRRLTVQVSQEIAISLASGHQTFLRAQAREPSGESIFWPDLDIGIRGPLRIAQSSLQVRSPSLLFLLRSLDGGRLGGSKWVIERTGQDDVARGLSHDSSSCSTRSLKSLTPDWFACSPPSRSPVYQHLVYTVEVPLSPGASPGIDRL